jgi:hypothetical protein
MINQQNIAEIIASKNDLKVGNVKHMQDLIFEELAKYDDYDIIKMIERFRARPQSPRI